MTYKKISTLIAVTFFSAIVSTAPAWGDSVYDLTEDWDDSINPNGVWSVNAGSTPLPPVEDLSTTGIDGWDVLQPGFTGALIPPYDITPVWFRSTGPLLNGTPDYEIGDIVTHTSRPDVPNSNVTWTSDLNGEIDILGSVWATREFGRSNDWFLYLNGGLLTSGTVAGGDPYDRSNPFIFELGSGGPSVLRNISISVGDVVKLEFQQLFGFGEDYVGVDLRIVAAPTKISCKNKGWQEFGFKNQGNCIQFVNTGKDKRVE